MSWGNAAHVPESCAADYLQRKKHARKCGAMFSERRRDVARTTAVLFQSGMPKRGSSFE